MNISELPWPIALPGSVDVGWVLIHSIWQYALIGIIAAVAMSVLANATAKIRYLVLVGCLAAMVASPALTLLARQSRLTPVSTANFVPGQPIANDQDAVILRTSVTSEPPASNDRVESVPTVPHATAETRAVIEGWLPALVTCWLLGAACFAMRPILGLWTIHRLQTYGLSCVSESLQRDFGRLVSQLHVRPSVRLRQSAIASVPMVVGWLKPVVLLPGSAITGLSATQLQAILAHELAHVRRHDYLVNLLQTVFESLAFYHPAVWWLSKQIRQEREHCCDDIAVGALQDKSDYGRALLVIAQNQVSGVLAVGASDGLLITRVSRLFATTVPTPHSRSGLLTAAPVMALMCICGFGMYCIAGTEGTEHPAPAQSQAIATAQQEAVGDNGVSSDEIASRSELSKRVRSLVELAAILDKNHRRAEAIRTLKEARSIVVQLAPDDMNAADFSKHRFAQSSACLRLVYGVAAIEGVDEARRLAHQISDPHHRATTLGDLVGMYCASNIPLARQLLSDALAAARLVSPIPAQHVARYESADATQQYSFDAVATGFAVIGDVDQALIVVHEIESRLRPQACRGSLYNLLKTQIFRNDIAAESKVRAVIDRLDTAHPDNPDGDPLFGSQLTLGATLEAAKELVGLKKWARVQELLDEIDAEDPDFLPGFERDGILTHVALGRLASEDEYEAPSADQFKEQHLYLRYLSLRARQLATNGQLAESRQLLDQVLEGIANLPQPKQRFSDTFGFVAQTYAILGDDDVAVQTALAIPEGPKWAIPIDEFSVYDLPYQAILGSATALALIAKVQLENQRPDAAVVTLRHLTLDVTDDEADDWYGELVKRNSLAEIAAVYVAGGERAKATRLLESAESREIRTAIANAIAAAAE